VSQSLPFYKMYPKDFDTDENVKLLDAREAGIYLFALNHAWVNDGLPSDPAEIGRMLKIPIRDFRAAWARVSKCFHTCDDGRLRNKRQEEERNHAKAKSEQASKSVRARRDRSPAPDGQEELNGNSTAALRSYEVSKPSVGVRTSESEYASSSECSSSFSTDDIFARFQKDYLALGGAFIPDDFSKAYSICWRYLDFEQKLDRVRALNRHSEEYASEPRFIPNPLKFLQTEWERPVRPPKTNGAVRKPIASVPPGLQALMDDCERAGGKASK